MHFLILVFFVWGNYWFPLFSVSSTYRTFVPFSVCFIGTNWCFVGFQAIFFWIQAVVVTCVLLLCIGELRTLKGLSRFQSSMAFHLAHLLVGNCLICLGIWLQFCDLDYWELHVYSIILRLGRLHFHGIFILDYLCIRVKKCCLLFNVNLSSTTRCHFTLSKFIIMIRNSWHGALKCLRNIAVPSENFFLNAVSLCMYVNKT